MSGLRDFQAEAIEEIQTDYRSGFRRLLLCSPTGSGKSFMTRHMVSRTNMPTLLLAHRENLVDMISDGLGKMPHGIIKSGRSMPDNHVCVGMMQTVAARLRDGKLPDFRWIISDECHLAMSPTWRFILDHFNDRYHLGMSATPCRLDGRALGDIYQKIIYGPSVASLVSRGFLVPCRVFAPKLAKLPTNASGSNMEQAAEVMNTRAITGDAVEHFRRLGGNRRTIVFTCNRAHCEAVAAEFRAKGISAVAIDSTMPDVADRIRAHQTGKVQVLVNVDLCTTGYDDPQIACGIFLRPTDSLALFLQMVGRLLRIFLGKRDAIMLDHVGATLQHGFCDDDRSWQLDGKPKRDQGVSVRQCTSCYAVYRPAIKCPECGHIEPVASAAARSVPKQVAGKLGELTKADLAAHRAADVRGKLFHVYKLKTADAVKAALAEIAREHGYASGWVRVQLVMWIKSRRARKSA